MQGIKSAEGRWSVSLCSCSEDTAHSHYGNVVLHIALDDLRDLGVAMQSVANGIERPAVKDFTTFKKGLVQ
jgi:hypothetical protein